MKIKDRKNAARELFANPPGRFEAMELSGAPFVPNGMTRAFRNNRYTVMIYDDSKTTHGPAILALIQKHDNTPIASHWREMQGIKNEIFGKEATAIEYYPAESQLIDTNNIYWMWVFPVGILPLRLR